MWVPDLDWPEDLFDDVIVVSRPSPMAAAGPALWRDMLTAWLGDEMMGVVARGVEARAGGQAWRLGE